jgi:hypothetical protein
MLESFDWKRIRAMEAYSRFIKEQSNNNEQKEWPSFNLHNYNKVFGPVLKAKLGKIFTRSFQLVYPFLQRDLYSRTPGKCIKWDGTFSFAKKTMDDKQSAESNNCLCVIFGQYGHILSFALVPNEEPKVFQLLNYYLRKR